MRDPDLWVELVAHAHKDGRWVARVVTSEAPPFISGSDGLSANGQTSAWPFVDGPTAAVALDALETASYVTPSAQPSQTRIPHPDGLRGAFNWRRDERNRRLSDRAPQTARQ